MQLVKLNEAASSDIEQLIQNREWSKAYQVASGFEKQDVIRQFINQLPNNWNHPEIVKNNPAIQKYLFKWVEELGFNAIENPFLYYIKAITDRGIDPDNATLTTINNAYANNKLNDQELSDKNQNHIVFNKDWLLGETNSSINDQKFMLDSYIWLSNPNNVKKMPLDKIGQMINFKDSRKDVNPLWNKNMYSNLPKTYGNLQGLDPVNRDDCLYARDIIIFADPNNIKESKLNTAFNVEKILHYDDFISDNNQQYQFTNQESQIINDMNNLLNSQPGLTQAVKDHIKANINSLVGRKLF